MNICVTGGAGYVGSSLVPQLLKAGHNVTVLDTFWYGDHLGRHKNLSKIKGDLRDKKDLARAFVSQRVVIHLACVSNDPSFDLNPGLGEEINLNSFPLILKTIRDTKVKRLIYASSSSVYGVSDLKDVREDSPKAPLTDYSKFKLQCEEVLAQEDRLLWTVLRPATVCGMSPRMRLDVVVNALSITALVKNRITLYGRNQKRPNINIKDMCNAYEFVLNNTQKTKHKTYNVGFENLRLIDIAREVADVCIKDEINIEEVETNDPRSYHINSDKILEDGFKPKHTIRAAINSIKHNFDKLHDPINNPDYYNVKKMKELGI